MKIKKYFSAFILILSAAFLFAQESQVNEKLVLTVEESVKLALENNKTLKSSVERFSCTVKQQRQCN